MILSVVVEATGVAKILSGHLQKVKLFLNNAELSDAFFNAHHLSKIQWSCPVGHVTWHQYQDS